MKDDGHKREGQTGIPAKKDSAKDPRRDRLKLALRENLRRRKSQTKGRGDVATAPFDVDDVSSHDASRKKPGA